VKARILGGLLVAALLVAGCNRQGANAPSVQEYEQKRAELLKRTQGPQKAVAGRKPEAATQEGGAGLVATGKGYEYSPTGKRDPFRSFVDEQKLRMARHERGPLEQFDLNQLTVVAVVWGTERPRALVQDPSGRGYVVQVGTPIGKNDGLVLRIGDNAVLVRETYVDYLGAQTTKEIEMRTRPISMTQGG
jgi:type IV pilus assembly protein PilP